jgi:hypothetical protein
MAGFQTKTSLFGTALDALEAREKEKRRRWDERIAIFSGRGISELFSAPTAGGFDLTKLAKVNDQCPP